MGRKGIWVIAEHRGGVLNDGTLETIEEARALADRLRAELRAIVLGACVDLLVPPLIRHGADVVVLAEDPLLLSYTTDGYVHVLAELISRDSPYLVLMSGTANGSDLSARLSARLSLPLVADCVSIKANAQGTVELTKPISQNRAYATYACGPDCRALATLRPGSRGHGRGTDGRAGLTIRAAFALDPSIIQTHAIEYRPADPATIDLTEAERIVAGGRGVGGPARWNVIEGLAAALHAAVGGSRVAMDEGCVSRERMIGQTGKAVRPRLYFAAGISGAVQHMGGVRESDLIVAINSDASAPILKQATLGVVGDLHQIIPSLLQMLGAMGDQDK